MPSAARRSPCAFPADRADPGWRGTPRFRRRSGKVDSHGRKGRIEFTPDGTRVAVPTDASPQFHSVETGEIDTQFRMKLSSGQGVALSADGRTAVVGDDAACVHIIDVPTLRTRARIQLPKYDSGARHPLRGAPTLVDNDAEAIVIDGRGLCSRINLDTGTFCQRTLAPDFWNGHFAVTPDARHAFAMQGLELVSVELPEAAD